MGSRAEQVRQGSVQAVVNLADTSRDIRYDDVDLVYIVMVDDGLNDGAVMPDNVNWMGTVHA